ncbi:MAG: M14 family metallopeptidase [Candidatus Sericytochromatia bacterium]
MSSTLLRRLSLAATAGLMMLGCSVQPGGLAPRPNAALQAQSRASNDKLAAYSPNFEPTFQNSFLSERPLGRSGNTVVKVSYTNSQQVDQLNAIGMDVWMVTSRHVLGQVNDEVFQRLRNSRLRFELISPEVGVSARNTFDPQYHTYDEMLAKLRAVTSKHARIASLHDIGDTWEKTQGKANRDLWAVHLSGQGVAEQKPGIVFFGNHHARELATVEIPLMLIDLLTEQYGKDPEITRLMDTRDIWIVPMVNPDGHILAERGDNWRKNTHRHSGAVGTDLNRNYGFQWGGGGASTSPSSDTYRGEAAFSEPETQAVRDFILGHKNLKVLMSYHSFSNLILWPWGYTKQRVNNPKLVEMGMKLGQLTGYKPQQAADLYVCSGTTDDFSFGQLGIISFTTEMGSWADGFDPPYSKVADFWNENRPAALYLIDQAGKL